MSAIKYKDLKEKYKEFHIPMADISVNGKSLQESKSSLLLGEIEIELTSGFEASAAEYRIYNCVDTVTGSYRMDELKPYIMLGAAVAVKVGYGGVLEEVFRGFIGQVQFMSEEEEIPCVAVTAMDIKGIMMANAYAKRMRENCYSQAVREIFEKGPYQHLMSQNIIEKLSITDTPDSSGKKEQKRSDTIEMVQESDYEFVIKAAKRFNYEFFIEKGIVYFRKAKSTEDTLIELGNAKGLLDFRISYDIRGLVQNIEVRGMDSGKGEAVAVKKKYNGNISRENKAKSLISKTWKIYVDPAVQTKEQAEYRASSLLEEMAYRFGELECSCVGLPELFPGNFIKITGCGTGADNRFYVTQVRHVIDSEKGFRTFLTGKASELGKDR